MNIFGHSYSGLDAKLFGVVDKEIVRSWWNDLIVLKPRLEQEYPFDLVSLLSFSIVSLFFFCGALHSCIPLRPPSWPCHFFCLLKEKKFTRFFVLSLCRKRKGMGTL